jgi:hypothetical protein
MPLKIMTGQADILERKADFELLEAMRSLCQEKLDEVLSKNYRNRGGLHRKILSLLVAELSAIRQPQKYTIKELFSHLLVSELIKIKYYTWGLWAVGPRRVCCRQSLNLIKMMFSHGVALETHQHFFATEDFDCFNGQISPLGIELLRHFWRHDFALEMAVVEQHRQAESRQRRQLPMETTGGLATIIRKEYAGLLNGNLDLEKTVVALNEFFLENFQLKDGQPYRRDSGQSVTLEDFKAYSILSRDTELLQVIYTELLALYRQAGPEEKAACLSGRPIVFNSKKLLRKMTQNAHTYNLKNKINQCAELFYLLKIERDQKGSIRLCKLINVESFDEGALSLQAGELMRLIAEIESRGQTRPAHVHYLPVGGKKIGQNVKIITEHIISLLKRGDRPYAGQTKKVEINLWSIICNYRPIVALYNEYAEARSKNIWLKRLTEGLYKSLRDYVAPYFVDFTITPEIINPKNGKAVNIPTTTTVKNHKILINHKGGRQHP